MKKIIGLTIAALLIIGIVGAGTYAYFSDIETSTGNTFTAGTLNLVNTINGTGTKADIHTGADGVNVYVLFDNIAPGDSGSITWTLENTGTLSGNLTMASSNVTFAENGSNEPEAAVVGNNGGGNGDLDEYLGVWLTCGGTDILGTTAAYVPMSGLEAVLIAQSQSIAPAGSLAYVLHWAIPTDIPAVDDNIIQSDTATLNITFALAQS